MNVDVWHYKDVEPQPLQQRMAPMERMRPYACSWKNGKFLQIEDDKLKDASVLKSYQYAVGPDETPNETPVKVGGLDYSDWYVGRPFERKEEQRFERRLSGPCSRRWRAGTLRTTRIATGGFTTIEKNTHANVTAEAGTDFEDVDYDGPQKEKPFDSAPVWLADDKGLLLYDKYDAGWSILRRARDSDHQGQGGHDRLPGPKRLPRRQADGARRPPVLRLLNDTTKASGVARARGGRERSRC